AQLVVDLRQQLGRRAGVGGGIVHGWIVHHRDGRDNSQRRNGQLPSDSQIPTSKQLPILNFKATPNSQCPRNSEAGPAVHSNRGLEISFGSWSLGVAWELGTCGVGNCQPLQLSR